MSFDKELAIKLAGYAGKVYEQTSFVKDDNGFLVENDLQGNQIISFRGTSNVNNWLEDSEFVKVKRDGLGYIHNGFADAWDDLRHEVIKMVDKSKPLYITGHSLGGAIAVICALSLFNSGYKIEYVYTYGQPRVGNSEFKDIFVKTGIKLVRFVNGYDVVPNVPKIFYYHVGDVIYMDDINGKILSSQKGFFLTRIFKAIDHLMQHYLESLSKLKV